MFLASATTVRLGHWTESREPQVEVMRRGRRWEMKTEQFNCEQNHGVALQRMPLQAQATWQPFLLFWQMLLVQPVCCGSRSVERSSSSHGMLSCLQEQVRGGTSHGSPPCVVNVRASLLPNQPDSHTLPFSALHSLYPTQIGLSWARSL